MKNINLYLNIYQELTKSVKEFRVGIIGCGRIGADSGIESRGSSRIESHAEAYFNHPQTKIAAVCDSDKDSLKRCCKRWNVTEGYQDIEELLNQEELDILSICSPLETHIKFLTKALEHPTLLGVLLEKPAAISLDEIDACIKNVSHYNVKVAVNHTRRFIPLYRQIQSEIQSKQIGDIQHIRVLYTKGIRNNGSHVLDVLNFFFGEPQNISVFPISDKDRFDPTLSLHLTYGKGFEAWVYGLDHAICNIFEIDILGSKERLNFFDQGHLLERTHVLDTTKAYGFKQLDQKTTVQPTNFTKAVFYAVENLVECIEQNGIPHCTLKEARNVLEWTLDIFDKNQSNLH